MDYFGKATTAKERNKEAEQDEKDKLSSYEDEIDNYKTWERTGESGNTVTISEDEYNMLKNNASYSTTEKVIGTWIDGEELFKKSYTMDTITKNKWNYLENGSDTIIRNVSGYIIASDGYYPLNYYTGGGLINYVMNYKNATLTNGTFAVYCSFSSSVRGFFTIEYTKIPSTTE